MIVLVEFEAVGPGDDFGGKDFTGGAVGDDAPVQKEGAGEVNGEYAYVVGAHDGGFALNAQAFECVEDHFLGGDIHMVEGFVQKEQIRVLGECSREHDSLLLAAGELAHLPLGEIGDFHCFQGRFNGVVIGAAGTSEPAHMGVAAHHHHLMDGNGETPVDAAALGNHRHAVPALAGGMAEDVDSAFGEGFLAEDGFEQGGLAGPVGAHQGHPFPRGNREGHTGENVFIRGGVSMNRRIEVQCRGTGNGGLGTASAVAEAGKRYFHRWIPAGCPGGGAGRASPRQGIVLSDR